MGFQTAVAPLPRREDEIYAIQKLQESWLNQPYFKYYMNEDVRRPKMQFADRQNKVRFEFFSNLLIFGFLAVPIAMLSRKWTITRTANIPRTSSLAEYTWKQRTSYQTRVKAYNHLSASVWGIFAFSAAFLFTNWEPIEDQNYSFCAKVEKMI